MKKNEALLHTSGFGGKNSIPGNLDQVYLSLTETDKEGVSNNEKINLPERWSHIFRDIRYIVCPGILDFSAMCIS
jgi:hypothetical protein